MTLVSIVAVEDTSSGPKDLDSVDGEDLSIRVADGEVVISNSSNGIFGEITYSIEDLIGDRVFDDKIRLELRIIKD